MSALQRFQIYCTLYDRQRYQNSPIHSIFVLLVRLTISDIFRRRQTVVLSSPLQRTFNPFTKQGFNIETKPMNLFKFHFVSFNNEYEERKRSLTDIEVNQFSSWHALGSHFSFHFSRTMRVIDTCAIGPHMNHKTAHKFFVINHQHENKSSTQIFSPNQVNWLKVLYVARLFCITTCYL